MERVGASALDGAIAATSASRHHLSTEDPVETVCGSAAEPVELERLEIEGLEELLQLPADHEAIPRRGAQCVRWDMPSIHIDDLARRGFRSRCAR